MVKPKYLYDIFDVIENDYVIINAKCAEVTEMIDMPHEVMSVYCITGGLYQGRYRITRKNIEVGLLRIDVSHIPTYLWEEFDQLTADIRRKASPDRLSKIRLKKVYTEFGRKVG